MIFYNPKSSPISSNFENQQKSQQKVASSPGVPHGFPPISRGILTLSVQQQLGDRLRESKLRLVDLAGNERWAPWRVIIDQYS